MNHDDETASPAEGDALMAVVINESEWQALKALAARREQEVSEQQQRINQAIRQLDSLIAGLGSQGRALSEWTDQARDIQANLRGK